MDTTKKAIHFAKTIFASSGYDGVSMRKIAAKMNIVPSVLYYHFKDKNELLRVMFDSTNTELGIKRSKLPQKNTFLDLLKQRIEFQIDNAEDIVAVLRYFLQFRTTFPKNEYGFVPVKAYLHIQEVLEYGEKCGELRVKNIQKEAKIITHAINGFLLEYYPKTPTGKEKTNLVNDIADFIFRAVSKNPDEMVKGKI